MDNDIETRANKQYPHGRNKTEEPKQQQVHPSSRPNRFTMKERCVLFLDSTFVTSFMTIITVYALYSDDVRLMAFDKDADQTFVILTSIAFFLFLLEIAVQCWCRDKYLLYPNSTSIQKLKLASNWSERWEAFKAIFTFGSFYFWLDLLATLSMVFEITWLAPNTGNDYDSNFENARAGRASRAGAKAARIVKVVRMIRLVRLVKLYKYFSKQPMNRKEGSIAPDDHESFDDVTPESHVGAEMSDRTTKKVIIGILIMLLVLPLLQVDSLEYIHEFGMNMLLTSRTLVYNLSKASEDVITVDWMVDESYFINTTNCINLTYIGFNDNQHLTASIPNDRSFPSDLRIEEKSEIIIRGENGTALFASFDITEKARDESFMNILLTTFVIFLLALGTMTFSQDVNSLVIIPIEKMVQLVREISENPLGKNYSLSPVELKGREDGMETTVLLRTISKIAGLMRVGFGEAGAEIIGKNLKTCNDEFGGKSINLLENGTKILSIFGFCDVRNFTDTTECLQEEVMLFVNRIAHILHSIVVQCDGAANKNIGDAFLITWKISPTKLGSCQDHGYAADKALYTFLKTMVEMVKHEDFICNFSPTALGALYEKMPGYKCRIGCGLHFGWAVEGAIGSDKKIDASYISPHVNWSEFLESSTKEYGVPILMSEPFFKLLSPEVSKYCRNVDSIKKSEKDAVIGLYTYEVNLDKSNFKFDSKEGMTIHARKTVLSTGPKGRKTVSNQSSFNYTEKVKNEHVIGKQRSRNNRFLGEAPEISLPPFSSSVWETDVDIIALRSHFQPSMRQSWNEGMKAYISGDWGSAIAHFNDVLEQTGGTDGPTIHILSKMKAYEYKVPVDWKGFTAI